MYKNDGLSEKEMRKKINDYKADDFNTGFDGDGVDTYNPIVKEFICGALENALPLDDYVAFFRDNNLKTSFCHLNTDGYQQGCQSWVGNSGGPIFDIYGKLMGILTRVNTIIGGEFHAGRFFYNSDNDDGDSYDKPNGRPDSNIHFLQKLKQGSEL